MKPVCPTCRRSPSASHGESCECPRCNLCAQPIGLCECIHDFARHGHASVRFEETGPLTICRSGIIVRVRHDRYETPMLSIPREGPLSVHIELNETCSLSCKRRSSNEIADGKRHGDLFEASIAAQQWRKLVHAANGTLKSQWMASLRRAREFYGTTWEELAAVGSIRIWERVERAHKAAEEERWERYRHHEERAIGLLIQYGESFEGAAAIMGQMMKRLDRGDGRESFVPVKLGRLQTLLQERTTATHPTTRDLQRAHEQRCWGRAVGFRAGDLKPWEVEPEEGDAE